MEVIGLKRLYLNYKTVLKKVKYMVHDHNLKSTISTRKFTINWMSLGIGNWLREVLNKCLTFFEYHNIYSIISMLFDVCMNDNNLYWSLLRTIQLAMTIDKKIAYNYKITTGWTAEETSIAWSFFAIVLCNSSETSQCFSNGVKMYWHWQRWLKAKKKLFLAHVDEDNGCLSRSVQSIFWHQPNTALRNL